MYNNATNNPNINLPRKLMSKCIIANIVEEIIIEINSLCLIRSLFNITPLNTNSSIIGIITSVLIIVKIISLFKLELIVYAFIKYVIRKKDVIEKNVIKIYGLIIFFKSINLICFFNVFIEICSTLNEIVINPMSINMFKSTSLKHDPLRSIFDVNKYVNINDII